MTDEVEEKEVPVLNFNGNSYEMDTLGEPEKYFIAQIQDLEAQIRQSKARLDQLEVARKGFCDKLEETLESPPEVEEE
tara:strand:+ start:539 stop:772 length:234 start_codon:yes stop_codon:yes gene_type:complete